MFEGIEKEPSQKAECTVICLHGLGADAADLAPLAAEICLSRPTRFIFPNAALRPISIFGDARVRGWYDIRSFDRGREEDQAGICQSADLMNALIEREIARGIPAHRIFLMGFSQGGAMSVYTGLRYPEALGGIAVLSGYLPLAASTPSLHLSLPIFMAHGHQDTVLPFSYAQSSEKFLKALGYQVEFHEYAMGHHILPQELADLSKFLDENLG